MRSGSNLGRLILLVLAGPLDFTAGFGAFRPSNHRQLGTNMGSTMDAESSEQLKNGLLGMDEAERPPPFRLGYVTDVEGNLDYFLRYVKESRVLRVEGDATSTHIRLDLVGDNTYFVYGGDAVDKGPGDIRMVTALVELKRRYPERVYLLVGNRDLNKLRFTAELSPDDLERPIDEIPPPFWDPKAVTLQEFLERKLKKEAIYEKKSVGDLNTRVNRIHYLLQHTLGCPDTFEFRRQELSLLYGRTHISDEEVVDNFIYEVKNREGSLRQYLQVADVAICIGNTLFCHGAVDQNTMKFVPALDTKFERPSSKPRPGDIIDNVQDWTKALNHYLKRGLEDNCDRPHWNEDRTSRGGEALMALQNRPATWGRSIICNCYGDGGCITTEHAAAIRNDPERKDMERTNPLAFAKVSSDPMDQTVASWLRKDGIQRVMVGHKPTGDCPAVLSALYTGVEVVSADTSFSDTLTGDNRGKALSVVEIAGTSPSDNQLHLSGTLKDGSHYSAKYVRLHPGGIDKSVGDPKLGTFLDGKVWWVKAAVDDRYYLTRGHGRKVEFESIPHDSLLQEATFR